MADSEQGASAAVSKRKSDSDSEQIVKRRKVMYSGGKNPLQLLNEKFKDVKYEFHQEGRVYYCYEIIFCHMKKLRKLIISHFVRLIFGNS